MQSNWRQSLGARLKQLRLQAHGGRGYSLEKAAETIQRTKAYLIRLETAMDEANPTLKILEQLTNLYGVDFGELFRPLIEDRSKINHELKEKLDFILDAGVERTTIGMTVAILAMYEHTKALKKKA